MQDGFKFLKKKIFSVSFHSIEMYSDKFVFKLS